MASHGFDKMADAASYDPVAGDYDRYVMQLSEPLAVQICRLAAVAPGQRVLDVGTGSGVAADCAARLVGVGGYVLGVDLSEGMIRTATATKTAKRAGCATPKFLVMDAEELDLPDRSFDAIISLCAVLHFPNIAKALSEMYRVLKPGGRLVVSFGYPRPVASLPFLCHAVRQVARRVLQPFKPVMKAPEDLIRLVRRSGIELHPETVETAWSRQGDTKARLFGEIAEAGFTDVAASWSGHEVRFLSPESFWDAQMAIVTIVRHALADVSFRACNTLREEFLTQARKTLKAGGTLVYPYGAFFVSGKRET